VARTDFDSPVPSSLSERSFTVLQYDSIKLFQLFFKLCSNWQHFYDAESGISKYMLGVSSDVNSSTTDIANLTEVSRRLHTTCVPVSRDLEHGKTYYTIVWAYNGAITQQKVVNISNGGID
jgi:hypothetical protein